MTFTRQEIKLTATATIIAFLLGFGIGMADDAGLFRGIQNWAPAPSILEGAEREQIN